jgi:hypothetical protein
MLITYICYLFYQIVHTYYQDLRAEIISLPKYGQLWNAERSTANPYGDWYHHISILAYYHLHAKYNPQYILLLTMIIVT